MVVGGLDFNERDRKELASIEFILAVIDQKT